MKKKSGRPHADFSRGQQNNLNKVSRFFFTCYNFGWKGLLPFLRKHRRLAENFDRRLAPADWLGPWSAARREADAPPLLWIQAASGGEAWLLHSLIPALEQSLPQGARLRLFCTSCTAQGLEVLRKLASLPLQGNLELAAAYFPLDAPEIMHKALELAEPALLVLLETELWPALLAGCREKKIPVLLINGRMSAQSLRAYKLLRFLWSSCGPGRILAVSQADQDRFAALFGSVWTARMPNMKFDRLELLSQALHPGVQEDRFKASRPVLGFASVRQEEEKGLFELIYGLGRQRIHGMTPAVLVAPRHMHRIGAWRAFCEKQQIPFLLRSQAKAEDFLTQEWSESAPNAAVFLWDSFGELERFYARTDLVFVGGTLAPLGGQNFLEALAAGTEVCIGPFWDNFFWAGDQLLRGGPVHCVASFVELQAKLLSVLEKLLPSDPREWPVARERNKKRIRSIFREWLGQHVGGSRIAAASILETLAAAPSLSLGPGRSKAGFLLPRKIKDKRHE